MSESVRVRVSEWGEWVSEERGERGEGVRVESETVVGVGLPRSC